MHTGPLATLAGEEAEERLVTTGLQAEPVQQARSCPRWVCLRRTPQPMPGTSVWGQRVPPVPAVPCSGPGGIGQRWDPAPSWDVPAEEREERIYRQMTRPGRGCCCQTLSFFNVSLTRCLLMGAFSQGKSVFPSPAGLLGLLTGFYSFISIGKNSPMSVQGLYQSRTGAGRGAGSAPGAEFLLPAGLSPVQCLGRR